ncbi:MAG: hypothetical protein M3Z04_13005 [Chloroflexota bacterium]|nr:hypothetical protein [Chloroflexota bacterium]
MLKEHATQLDLFSPPAASPPQPDPFHQLAAPFPPPAAQPLAPLPAAPTTRPVAPAADEANDTLTTEIGTLHDLLTAVAGSADLDLTQRVTAYCKGADTLARLLRAQHGLAPSDPAADLTALLARLDESAEF